MKAKFIEVSAEVRYWEDGEVNGVDDINGILMPFIQGKLWKPIISLEDGTIINWPQGTTACIHYKVCDAGEYWLLDENKNRIAKWKDYYVPNDFLCFGDNGYGDYIVFNVDVDGKIIDWHKSEVDIEDWATIN